ncbi:NnrU family protein [uncultured Nisaea sp.]|uniref:NnrU family protein n=1 Tax=uncultured Nisaea sp. TaxID=538215 RepID=UPI0030EEC8E6|tara:strand:+ start:303 stop:998 length:696 start_codon:yes stop_codon:yes gene_type:complete
MTGSLDALFAAVVTFVGGHFLLGWPSIRATLIEQIGINRFRGLFSLAAGVAMVWMLLAYGDAPYLALWAPPLWTRWIPNIVMPLATILLVCGYSPFSPTAMMTEEGYDEPHLLRGILTVTRHPVMMAIGLWALAHLSVRGDAASMMLFGGIAVLAFGGMVKIDAKKRAEFGAKWAPFELTTSVLPFRAILEGRTRLDWKGIGWLRLGGGLLLWAVLHGAHPYITGVSAVPL